MLNESCWRLYRKPKSFTHMCMGAELSLRQTTNRGVNLSETTKWSPSQATEDVAQTHQVWPCGVLYSRRRAGHFRLPWQSTSQWNQTIVVVEELGLERSTLKRLKDSSSADETSRVIMEYVLKEWLSEKEQVDELAEGILEFQGRVECWRWHVA